MEWNLQAESGKGTRQVSVTTSGDPVTALEYLLGERTLIVGTGSGQVMTWAPQDFPQSGEETSHFEKS
ncbi:MAG: hypothetical protein R3B74_16270 [Nitrospirales bacterium]|nr:hypothetical protein [Nitrospirales bacterium]